MSDKATYCPHCGAPNNNLAEESNEQLNDAAENNQSQAPVMPNPLEVLKQFTAEFEGLTQKKEETEEQIRELENQKSMISDNIESLTAERDSRQEELKKIAQDTAELFQKKSEAEEILTNFQAQKEKYEADIEALDAEKEKRHEQLAGLAAQIEQLSQERGGIEEMIPGLRQQKEELAATIENLGAEQDKRREDLQNIEEQIQALSQKIAESEECEKRLLELQEQERQLKADIENLTSEQSNVQNSLNELAQEVDGLMLQKAEAKASAANLQALQEQEKQLVGRIGTLTAEKNRNELEANKLSDEVSELTKKKEELDRVVPEIMEKQRFAYSGLCCYLAYRTFSVAVFRKYTITGIDNAYSFFFA